MKKSIKISQQQLFHVNEVNWPAETLRIINDLRESGALMAYIDLFCGAGGTSTGVERAYYLGSRIANVILGINHDRVAIESHKANHPNTLHLIEDIRDVNLAPIKKMVAAIRKALPYIKIVLWASAECTHHSKANGGSSRDADSRSLPEELYRYDEALRPDLIQVENVTDFRTWGPIEHKHKHESGIAEFKYKLNHPVFGMLYSKKGKKDWVRDDYYWFTKKKGDFSEWMVPIKARKREFFDQWVTYLKSLGLKYEDRDLNSADVGAYTTRVRYFGQFVRNGMQIHWPEPTHAKQPTGHLKPYRPVKDVLDFKDKGESIFIPGKITSDNSFRRYLEGCIKFVAGGKKEYEVAKAFLSNYHGGTEKQATRVHSVENPLNNLDTQNRYSLNQVQFLEKGVEEVVPFIVQFNNNCDANSTNEPNKTLTAKDKFAPTFLQFITQHNTGESMSYGVDKPARVITCTGGNQSLVSIEEILPLISVYHGNGHNCHSVDNPSPVVAANDGMSLIGLHPFIFRQFGGGGGHLRSVEDSAGCLPPIPKMNLVSPEAWLDNPGHGGHASTTDKPSPVIIARQDKAPLHLCQVQYADEEKLYGIVIYKKDSPVVKELKRFMAMYGIVDIKMRMLNVPELLRIQGFGDQYILKGTQGDQKKFIGNSV